MTNHLDNMSFLAPIRLNPVNAVVFTILEVNPVNPVLFRFCIVVVIEVKNVVA